MLLMKNEAVVTPVKGMKEKPERQALPNSPPISIINHRHWTVESIEGDFPGHTSLN